LIFQEWAACISLAAALRDRTPDPTLLFTVIDERVSDSKRKNTANLAVFFMTAITLFDTMQR